MRAVLRRSAEPPLPMGVVVRRLRPDDASALGSLMVSAYAGTVDDHGQPPEFHASEARRTIAGEYGPVEWDASLLATFDQQLIGATVVTLDRGHLLLAFALVSPEWRNRGVGTALVIAAVIGSAPWVPRSGRLPSRSATLRSGSMSESGFAWTQPLLTAAWRYEGHCGPRTDKCSLSRIAIVREAGGDARCSSTAGAVGTVVPTRPP